MSYLRLGEIINPERFVQVTFYVESTHDILEVAEALAAESSIGTWTEVSTMGAGIKERLGARVVKVEGLSAEEVNLPARDYIRGLKVANIKIAYPLDLFETDNIPQLFSDVAGNVFGMKVVENLRVKDIEFPSSYVSAYQGPAFGVPGIRKYFNEPKRPLLGTIIKPKVGLSPLEHAEVAYQAWVGGVDVVKDDENLTDQSFNRFEERLEATMEMKRKAEAKTKSKKMYAPNISGRIDEMLERIKMVQKEKNSTIMLDVITVGFSGVQYIRKLNTGLIIHGHRAMHGAFTHGTRHGISMLVIAKVSRLVGIDQLHTGTVLGKMEGSSEQVTAINDFLRGDLYGLNPTMPIASGGVYPGLIPAMVDILGRDVIINLGGGIHGHPQGTKAGAKAALQAVKAAVRGVSLREQAKKHKELALALEKWGIYDEKREDNRPTYTYNV